MGRKYTVPWYAAGLTSARELVQISGNSTGKVVRIAGVHVEQHTDYGDAQAEGLRLQLYRATGGGAGTAITPSPHSPSDTAFAGTAKGGNQATGLTASTPGVVLAEGGMNVQAGWHWTPPPGYEWEISGAGLIVLNLQTAPGDSMDFEITFEIEELG